MTKDENREKEAARKLFTQPCDFVLAASVPEHFGSLEGKRPEVAFWGRSNVGKSSLINALVARKGLARASNTPGRTQQIVFFNLADQLLFADFPGYGHANAPKEEIVKWQGLIDRYLKTRARLRCVLLLIDGRRGITEKDKESMARLDKLAVSYQIVLTKADQVKADELVERTRATKTLLKKHPAARPDIFVTSAEKGKGLDDLRLFLMGFAENG